MQLYALIEGKISIVTEIFRFLRRAENEKGLRKFAVSVCLYYFSDKNVFTSQPGCGISGAQTTKIVGGEEIKQFQYPWLCSLKTSSGSHICGVTLLGIHPHVKETILVGAAHCYSAGN